MNIQIFGIVKCFETRKAERYFKERGIKYQFVDLERKSLSKGEVDVVINAVGLDALINRQCRQYMQLNLHRIGGSKARAQVLLNNPVLYNTPIVRNGRQATVGYRPEVWSEWE